MENEEFCDSIAHSSSTQSKAMAAPAASLLSLRCPSSPFKAQCNFTRLKLHSNKKTPLVIINQAAAAASVVTKSPGTRVERCKGQALYHQAYYYLTGERFPHIIYKVLGDGELSAKLNIKARSAAAVAKNLTRAEEYFAEKRAAAAASEPTAA